MSQLFVENHQRAGGKPASRRARRARMCRRLLLAALLFWPTQPAFASLQLPTPDLRMDAYPTGAKPFGVDLVGADDSGIHSSYPALLSVVVANSGEDSISIFRVKLPRDSHDQFSLELLATVHGIPSAYAVAGCNRATTGDKALITSPTDNSVTVVNAADGKLLGKLAIGHQPHAVACFESNGVYKGAVSNAGDDTLVIFDVASLAVEARIPGVAGAKGAHGISIYSGTRPWAWVAGSSADALTVVDLTTYQVLARLPVRGPTSVHDSCVASAPGGNITCYGTSLTPQILSSGIPTPADFCSDPYSMISAQGIRLASTGAGSSVVYYLTLGGGTKTLPGIPGAAGLSMYSRFNSTGGVSRFFVAVTSPDSNRMFLIQEPPISPAPPREFSVVNGASFAANTSVAPNSLASLFLTTGLVQNTLANSLPLPKALGGVSLRVGGSLAYDSANSRWTYSATGSVEAGLTYVGPSQMNFQVPPGINPGDSVPAQLQLPNGKTLLTTLRLVSAAPGIFSILMNGQGQGAVLNQDNSQNGDPQRFLGVKPAARSSVIQIFATGAGETTPSLAAGEAAPGSGNPLVLTKVQPTVTIGGKNAKVQFSGMAPGFVGLWQINAEVPADVTPGMALPLVITAGGAQSNTVTIAVQ